MKRTLIGALVGGIIIFAWQTVSWVVLHMHDDAHKKAPNQEAIMALLTALPEEGGYFLPNVDHNAPESEHEKLMEDMKGKPWATINYHKSWEANMTMNMVRGLLSNIIMVWLLCWIFSKVYQPRFGTIFLASLAVGLITFINQPYTGHIWYEMPDINAFLTDSLVSWGLCGIWLGWLFNRRPVI